MTTAGNSTYVWGPGAGGTAIVTREDLSDMVTMITPWQTPLYNASPKTKATSTLHEWVTDIMDAATTSGAIEGEAFTSAALQARVRRQNYTQIFRKDVEITNTMQEMDPAGVPNEYNYQIQKGLKELAKNIESRAFDIATSALSAGTTAVGRRFASLEAFITANTADAGQNAATSTPITETAFNNALELIYTAGGNPETCYVSPGVKRDISAFAGPGVAALPTNTRNIEASAKKLVQAVDVYDSDYGLIQIVMSRWVVQTTNTTILTGRVWFIERAKVRFSILRPMRHYPIASVGDSTRGMVLTELTLEVLAGDSCGAVRRVST